MNMILIGLALVWTILGILWSIYMFNISRWTVKYIKRIDPIIEQSIKMMEDDLEEYGETE